VAVFVNASAVASSALDDQAQRLTALKDRVAALNGGVFAEWTETPIDDRVGWDRVQSIATHNSYALAPNALQSLVLGVIEPGESERLAYNHPPLWDQLELGVRSLELDVRVHSDGALRNTHVPLIANASNAPDFALGLEEIAL